MITSLRDFQAAPGVTRGANKEDFWVTLQTYKHRMCSESRDDSTLRKVGTWQVVEGDMMLLSVALIMTHLLQVQIRPSNPADLKHMLAGRKQSRLAPGPWR